MKKTFIKASGIAFLMIFFLIGLSWAKDGRNHRQHHQSARIHDGVRSGELTRGERRVLGHEQRKINQYRRHAQSDGHFSRHEKSKLNRMTKRADRHIYKLKHNDRRAYRFHTGYNSHRPRAFYRENCYRHDRRYHNHGFSYFSGSWYDPNFAFSFSTGRR